MTDNNLREKVKKNKEKRRKARLVTKKGSRKVIVAVSTTVVILGLVSAGAYYYFSHPKTPLQTQESVQIPAAETIPVQNQIEEAKDGIADHIVTALYEAYEGYRMRPETVELTLENTSDFVDITSCKINEESKKVELFLESEGIPKSDDKFYYLFTVNGFDDDPTITGEPITKVYKNDVASMECNLFNNSENSRLFQRFTVAVKSGDDYIMVSTPQFVSNPEAVATHPHVYMNPRSKKGILVDYSRVFTGQLQDLGVNQIALNIPIASILGPSTNALFPSIHYTYNGKNYTFNGKVLAGFDSTVSELTKQGISTTAILLNSYSNAYIDLIHPDARKQGVCPYYMFNGSTEEGVELLAAVGSFLADRYSTEKHGKISNWVIANEINARKEWNYLNYTDVNTYSKEYAKGFRVLYNAIKSMAGDARVYISLDQTWNRKLSNSPDYDGKDVLDAFNDYITECGNIDWSIAYHPYNIPLTSTKTWASSKYVNHTTNTPMISMQNIEVLVNYLNQESLLGTDNQCRSIMITELGYTSSAGEQNQAAAIAYAYYKVDYYKDIDGLLLNRQTDDATEIAQGLATGITTAGGGHKYSYNVFKYMDTDKREEYTEFAKSIIGISDWKKIIY